MTDLMNIIWFALNYEFQFSCNGSYVNQERETSITNQDLIIFSVLNREKNIVVLLRVSNGAFVKR